jgi:hypothetical protein
MSCLPLTFFLSIFSLFVPTIFSWSIANILIS